MQKSNGDKKNRKTTAGKILTLAGILILIITIITALTLLVPRLLGYMEFSVVSGSMEPGYPVGSLIFVEKNDPSLLVKGDVISFYSDLTHSGVVTHRVVSNDKDKGEVITKGDANKKRDLSPVKYPQVIGTVSRCIPGAGFIAGAASGMKGIIVLVALVGAGFALIIASTYMKKQ